LKGEAVRRGLDNVRTVEADVSRLEAIEGGFDGAFCRFFLAFLIADLDRVLCTIHRSLKPGGVLAAMEYLTLGSATCSPESRGFDAHTRAWVDYYRAHGADTSGRATAGGRGGAGSWRTSATRSPPAAS
jgi:ubiquinone/menaquinone biosynthesis C-methylase UbiE